MRLRSRSHALRALALAALAAMPAAAQPAARPAPATLVIRHARAWTGDAAQPAAEAIAARGDTIVYVGSDAGVAAFTGPRTRVIDAGGRALLPGFTDTHVHFVMGALGLERADLEGARDVAELRARLVRYRASHPGTGWVTGRGWNYAMFGAEALPHKRHLDDLFPDRPVFLSAYDGHTSWVNSAALKAAGITRDTPDPANGVIVRDANGEPTGALKEKASGLVSRLVPPPTRAEVARALRAGMQLANRLGVTRVHSAGGDFEWLPVLDSLRAAGALTVRFDVGYRVEPPMLRPSDVEAITAARERYRGEWVSGGLVKLMVDGVIESHTAAMLDPYTDQPTTSGALFWDPDAFAMAVRTLDAQGLRLMTHAIGERAVRVVLDAYQGAARANGTRARVHRVEHVETVAALDIPRFGALGVIAGMQPLHAYPDINTDNVWAGNIGSERALRAWAWRRITDAGGRLAFGSDWPVVTLNPWPGVQVAVTRQTEDGRPPGGFVPSERLPLDAVLRAYTLGAAVAGAREGREGTLAVGKVADLVLLARDPFAATPSQLAAMTVDLTVSGGRVVHEARARRR